MLLILLISFYFKIYVFFRVFQLTVLSITSNILGFGQMWKFPIVSPKPMLIYCLIEVKNLPAAGLNI
jgi:hypothetical protein